MKNLFEELEVNFIDNKPELRRNSRQGYYNYLATLVKDGEGLLPDESDSDELIHRKLTDEEAEEIYFKIGKWLQSLN